MASSSQSIKPKEEGVEGMEMQVPLEGDVCLWKIVKVVQRLLL